jgi:putative transposase
VLVGKLAERCQQLIEQKCQEKGWQLFTLAIQPDHLHVFVRCFLSNSAAEVVKESKGVTSFFLRKEFPELLKLPSLWTRSYFASTAGNISQETFRSISMLRKDYASVSGTPREHREDRPDRPTGS